MAGSKSSLIKKLLASAASRPRVGWTRRPSDQASLDRYPHQDRSVGSSWEPGQAEARGASEPVQALVQALVRRRRAAYLAAHSVAAQPSSLRPQASRGTSGSGPARLRWLARRTRCPRSEEHTSELQSLRHLVCRLLLEKKNK